MRGVKFPGQLHSLIDDLGVRYVYADATGPMAALLTRNYRHWLWTEGVILIFDDLMSHDAGTFDWLLHYEGNAQEIGNGVSISNGVARATVQFLYPKELEIRHEEGRADHQPDKKIPYLAFRTREKARVQKFLTAVIPETPGGQPSPEVELVEAQNSLGVRITNGNGLTDVYLNLEADGRRMHLNSNNTIAGWETDAYLLAFSRPQQNGDDPAAVTRFFVSGASYLRRGGRVYLDSLTKVDRVWRNS